MMALMLNLIVSVLLLATIFYAWRLGKNIKQLRQSKEEIITFIRDFNESVIRAQASIFHLKKLNSEVGVDLRDNLDRARFLANDLAFLIQKGNEVADNIDGKITISRSNARASRPEVKSENDFTRRAEKISAGQVVKAFDNVSTGNEADKMASKRKALENAMEQVARANAELRNAENKGIRAPQPALPPVTTELKQRRLFDALRWNRQL